MGLVYVAWNKDNNKPYVGQTVQTLKKRLSQHQDKGHYFHKSLKKNGIDSFKIQTVRSPSDEQWALNWLEDVLMEDLNSMVPNGYNLQGAGSHGKMSEESKGKMSEAKKGCTPWNKGKTGIYSKETLRKISESRIGRPGPWLNKKRPNMTGSKNPMYGKKGSKHPRARAIILIHSNGAKEYFGCMSDACRKYDLFYQHLSAVAQGKRNHHKGYRCKYYD